MRATVPSGPARNWFLRCGLLGWLLTVVLQPLHADEKQLAQRFEQQVEPFLKTHCVRCHNVDEMTSGIRVDDLDAALPDRHLKLWEGVLRQIERQAMPPEDEPQPTDAERKQVQAWISDALNVARLRPAPRNGSVRRLTVAQYRNTLRELLQLEDDLADVLPPDAVSKDGFVNNQDTLTLSPLLLEAYFEIAEKALDRVIVDVAAKPVIQNFRVDLGQSINPTPCPDQLILGADSLLLDNADFVVQQLAPAKPFPFTPFAMQTTFKFIEGYQGNDTVRGWRDFDSIYHAVFACLRGTRGYPKGEAYTTIPQGLLLRPAIPSAEVFGVESTYGPRANFKISLRELPDDGRFRVTVTAARYEDGLLLDQGVPVAAETPAAITVTSPGPHAQTVNVPHSGLYQIDIYGPDSAQGMAQGMPAAKSPPQLTLNLGERRFVGTWQQPAFLIVRLGVGELPLAVHLTDSGAPARIVLTPVAVDSAAGQKFVAFESRRPRLGVHVGLRRDCGSTLAQVGEAQAVASTDFQSYLFEGAIRNFPSPDVEKDNVNYLAGIREIGVRSEYTDGRDMPQLLIRSVEFEGPFYEQWPPAPHRLIFKESDHPAESPEYAREVLTGFATRAFRRPLTDQEIQTLWNVYSRSRDGGHGFTEGVKDALLVVLTSPQFLLLTESSATPDPEPVDDYELASKLSYFLTNGPPDQQLLQLAAAGNLRPQLHSQVDRLLDDPASVRFAREFTSQWLSLDKFQVLEPDRSKFPALSRDTRTQLAREPIEFFRYLVRHNLPIRNLVSADFVLANETVASYYELPERPESGFDFVAIPHRREELGGLFSQAALMAGLSDGRESNPVKRGAWVARKIVGEPPDDPPPNVPPLREDTTHLTLRERLEKHRNQAGCVQCHTKIDPWGVALEQFDAGGRFKLQPVDAKSTLPDGTEVDGVTGLKQYLTDRRIDQVAFNVLKHLMVYANGRALSYGETAALRLQVETLKSDGYRMRDLIQYVVHSEPFLTK